MAMNTNTSFIPIPTRTGLRMVDESVLRKETEEFENGFPDGVYAVPRNPKEPRLKVNEMYAYCRQHGLKPNELDKKQMDQFLEYD